MEEAREAPYSSRIVCARTLVLTWIKETTMPPSRGPGRTLPSSKMGTPSERLEASHRGAASRIRPGGGSRAGHEVDRAPAAPRTEPSCACHPGRRIYVWADGTVVDTTGAGGGRWCFMQSDALAQHGLARRVPCSLNINDDGQKLAALGRSAFAPPLRERYAGRFGFPVAARGIRPTRT
jgi:hypothetical protein